MEIAKWDDSYETGHALVDTQHKALFRMVNTLHEAIMEDRGKEALMPTLQALAGYTIEHFRSEEELMEQVQYPAMSAHIQKHEELAKQVKELKEKCKAGKTVLTITLSNFLAKWLRQHIKEDDMALAKFLRGQAKAAAASIRR